MLVTRVPPDLALLPMLPAGPAPEPEQAPDASNGLAWFSLEETPPPEAAPVDSPTVAIVTDQDLCAPAAETPHARVTLPWPIAWTYEPTRRPLEPEAPDAVSCAVEGEAEREVEAENSALEVEALDADEHVTDSQDVEAEDACARAGEIDHVEPPLAADSATRADELLMRFSAQGDGGAAVRAAARSLRALAGVDLTPSAATIPPAYASLASVSERIPALLPPDDDVTPPATSPAPISVPPPPRASRGRPWLSVAAFVTGLAGATALMHVRPDFPDGFVAVLAHALPASDPPAAAPAEPPSPDAPVGPSTGETPELEVSAPAPPPRSSP